MRKGGEASRLPPRSRERAYRGACHLIAPTCIEPIAPGLNLKTPNRSEIFAPGHNPTCCPPVQIERMIPRSKDSTSEPGRAAPLGRNEIRCACWEEVCIRGKLGGIVRFYCAWRGGERRPPPQLGVAPNSAAPTTRAKLANLANVARTVTRLRMLPSGLRDAA